MFDSGFGGLTVARAVIDLLPAEDLVYVGDTARYPYGPRPADEVRQFASELATSLVTEHGVKAIIVACNTAAASGLDDLRNEFGVPIIDVVAPGAAALVEATESGRAAVIGTVGTVSSGAYLHAVEHAAMVAGRRVTLTSAACPGFVEFVERGQTAGDEVTVLAERLLAPVIAADVDALLLGCTHYPFLNRVIGDVIGTHVTLVSSADETAFSAARVLGELGLLRHHGVAVGRHRFLSSGDVDAFRELGRSLLGPELDAAEPWCPGSPRNRPASIRSASGQFADSTGGP
jgi:glutamate racemase